MMLSPNRFTRLALLTLVLLAPSNAHAQPGVPLPTSWELQRLLLGAVNAIRLLPLSEVQCGVARTVTQPNGSVRWEDPAQFPTINDCQWVDPGTGPIRTAGPGVQYQMRMTAIAADAGRSEFSALVDFRMPTPTPAVPTGVRIRPGQ